MRLHKGESEDGGDGEGLQDIEPPTNSSTLFFCSNSLMGLSGKKPQLDRDPAHHSTHSSLLTATAFSLSRHSNPFEVFILLQNLYQLCIHLKQHRKKLLLHCQLNRQTIAITMRLIWLGWESTLPGLTILTILVIHKPRLFSTIRSPFKLSKVSSWDDFHFL